MAIGEQGHQELQHHVLLAHDHLSHLLLDQVHEGAGLLDAVVQLADALGGDGGRFRSGLIHMEGSLKGAQRCDAKLAGCMQAL
jgi:hypothetical protein